MNWWWSRRWGWGRHAGLWKNLVQHAESWVRGHSGGMSRKTSSTMKEGEVGVELSRRRMFDEVRGPLVRLGIIRPPSTASFRMEKSLRGYSERDKVYKGTEVAGSWHRRRPWSPVPLGSCFVINSPSGRDIYGFVCCRGLTSSRRDRRGALPALTPPWQRLTRLGGTSRMAELHHRRWTTPLTSRWKRIVLLQSSPGGGTICSDLGPSWECQNPWTSFRSLGL